MSANCLPASLSALFLKKNIYLIILCYLTKFHCLVALYSWDVAQYVYCNCSLTRLWRHKFRNQPYLSNQAVFSIWQKCQDKSLNILRTKRALTWRKIIFFSIFEANKTIFFGRWFCPTLIIWIGIVSKFHF